MFKNLSLSLWIVCFGSPLMITRYLLVRSTVSVDEEALDLVVDYMTDVEVHHSMIPCSSEIA